MINAVSNIINPFLHLELDQNFTMLQVLMNASSKRDTLPPTSFSSTIHYTASVIIRIPRSVRSRSLGKSPGRRRTVVPTTTRAGCGCGGSRRRRAVSSPSALPSTWRRCVEGSWRGRVVRSGGGRVESRTRGRGPEDCSWGWRVVGSWRGTPGVIARSGCGC